jgi:hypothetical protein
VYHIFISLCSLIHIVPSYSLYYIFFLSISPYCTALPISPIFYFPYLLSPSLSLTSICSKSLFSPPLPSLFSLFPPHSLLFLFALLFFLSFFSFILLQISFSSPLFIFFSLLSLSLSSFLSLLLISLHFSSLLLSLYFSLSLSLFYYLFIFYHLFIPFHTMPYSYHTISYPLLTS